MSDQQDLQILLNGHIPIINIETFEERRALEIITSLAIKALLPVFNWSVTEGLSRRDINLGTQRHVIKPVEVLKHIKAIKQKGIYILIDFHHYLDEPLNQRLLKEIAMDFEKNNGKIVLLSPHVSLSDGIAKMSVNFHLNLPNAKELEQLVIDEATSWQNTTNLQVKTDRKTLDRLIKNLSGLTYKDAKRLIRNAIMDDNALSESDLPDVMDAKYSLLNKDNILSFEYDTASFSEIGGMNRLKEWLKQRQDIFHGHSNAPKGIDKPKGTLLLGVQGCGKSLAAKAVAGVWGVPLLRLDFGMMYNKYIGETERNIRKALKMAEAMAPCVLWIDEIEKGISGDDEDGTSKRILATLLTWMAENKYAVFIVATANQIDDLPPELIRKGRVDEIFFVDLPTQNVRELIFSIHFVKRDISLTNINISELALASNGFSGAEIEQAVISLIYSSHHLQKEINTEDALKEIKRTRPLSVVMSEKIHKLRSWASERTVPAD